MSADCPNPKKLCKERGKVLMLPFGVRLVQSRAVICGTYHLEKAQHCNSDTISKMALFLFVSLTLKQGRVIQDSSRCPPREGGREGGKGRRGIFLRELHC